ncbi:glycosyltransferase domain-containing protein [Noumeavirus]|uniref:glycosyltransferase domain-containing protein n=1 Tax=Noumeavirus TaxID=1955558 RepID=UPI000982F7C4|nr:glycosyltransferase domain-containing protein [Noumeavirus]AQM73342.1 glycosyltransferase domain-containing protein [Noumeavirus]
MDTFELAFLLSLAVFFFMLWKWFWKVQIIFNPQILGEKTPEVFGKELPERYNQLVRLGMENAKNSRIVFCGMLRDCEDRVPEIIHEFERFDGMFRDWRLLVVENDSVDNTRKLLLDWAKKNKRVVVLGCGVNAKECKMSLPKTLGHQIDSARIDKMSLLRNIYLDYTKKYFANWDYLVPVDLDATAKWYMDGFFNSLGWFKKDKNLSVLAASGILRFPSGMSSQYDSFAIIGPEPGALQTFHNDRWLSHAIGRKLEYMNLEPGADLEPVYSAFGGICIYRLADVLKYGAKYDMNDPENQAGRVYCEHTLFNSYFPKGSKAINPSMVFLCLSNDNA